MFSSATKGVKRGGQFTIGEEPAPGIGSKEVFCYREFKNNNESKYFPMLEFLNNNNNKTLFPISPDYSHISLIHIMSVGPPSKDWISLLPLPLWVASL
jgi:hypothetical protein